MSKSKTLIAVAVSFLPWVIPSTASAVGNGVPFIFRETPIPGTQMHALLADSLDFTYHACVAFTDADSFVERGYFWVSSFQDVDSVVDSQINHFLANGYHIYARYTYDADQWMGGQPTPNGGTRLNYVVNDAALVLYLDPAQDTVLAIQDCAVVVAGNGDDVPLGMANVISDGQKSETNDIANGDFEIIFTNWVFTAPGQALFRDPATGFPLAVPTLVFNGNVTLLGGPLGMGHRPEGSGNFYWVD